MEKVVPFLNVWEHSVRPIKASGAVIHTLSMRSWTGSESGPRIEIIVVHKLISQDEFLQQLYELKLKEAFKTGVSIVSKTWSEGESSTNVV